MKYLHKEFKTAINKLKYPDSWFWSRYTINPYSGCEHACIYCDARRKQIIEFIEPILEKSKDLKQKKGLDKFL